MQDNQYFGRLIAQMHGGGNEALLDYLLNLDISRIDLRTIPETGALFEQKVSTLAPEQAWWLDILTNGFIPGDREGSGETPKHSLFNSYITHAQRAGRPRRSSETKVGMFLKKFVPEIERISVPMGDHEVPGYAFPDLSDCRAAFGRLARYKGTWDEPEHWEPDPYLSLGPSIEGQ